MKRQRGAALMVILMILGVAGAYFAVKALNNGQARRERETANTLAQAKDALVGFAATYQENDATHANDVLGYLPCPDANNDSATPGVTDTGATCGNLDVSIVGRLPWNTIGLPPLLDNSSECLWYAVSGNAKANTNKTNIFNWDTVGQLIVHDADHPPPATPLAGATAHEQPLAVILAPNPPIGVQDRSTLAGSSAECRGNNTLANYLEGSNLSPATGANSVVTLSTTNSVSANSNNDRGIWITSKDIFDRVKRNPDFKANIDTLMNDLATYLNNLPPAGLPARSGANKGVDTLITNFLAANTATYANTTLKRNVLNNWRDNLLYTGPVTASANGNPGCAAILIFGGERTTRTAAPLTAQTRLPAPATDQQDATNYLEGPNATFFPAGGNYSGPQFYNPGAASSDVIRCITGLPAGATQQSFADNMTSFNAVGSGITQNADKSISITDAPGTAGGCFWLASAIPLAGKTLRAYYDFKFAQADSHALTNLGADRGNGFSLQMVRSDFAAPPTGCGAESNMGVLTAGTPYGYDPNGTNSLYGQRSLIFETDVYHNSGHSDPAGNHSAILLNGTLDHSVSGSMSAACNGSAGGCQHAPANKFEEDPLLPHNQRIEIATGCNATCTVCNPASHATPNTYARMTAWVDCSDCNDVSTVLYEDEWITTQANREFSAPGNWSGTNWSIVSGAYSHATAGVNPALLANSALVSPPAIASNYRISLKIVTSTAGILTLSFGGNSAALVLNPGSSAHSVHLKAVSTSPLTITPDTQWTGSIDNIRITPRNTDYIGDELIAAPQNRDFSAPGNWAGSNWAVATGSLSHTVLGANPVTLPDTALIALPFKGFNYRVSLTSTTVTPGSLTLEFGGHSIDLGLSAAGSKTHTVQMMTSATGNLRLIPDALWSGSIDNISIVSENYVRPPPVPTVKRCAALLPELNSVYLGFTGGFRSGTSAQGVTLRNLFLRSQ